MLPEELPRYRLAERSSPSCLPVSKERVKKSVRMPSRPHDLHADAQLAELERHALAPPGIGSGIGSRNRFHPIFGKLLGREGRQERDFKLIAPAEAAEWPAYRLESSGLS